MTDRERQLGYCEEAQTYCSIAEQTYKEIRADAIKYTELFREIFLEELVNQSVDIEETTMYRNICAMAWSKFLEQLKEANK